VRGKGSTKQRFMMEASSLEESDLKGMEVCNFRGTEVALPLELIEQVSSFHIYFIAKHGAILYMPSFHERDLLRLLLTEVSKINRSY